FYPKSQQGTALGLNAGLGNLGVSVMQCSVPLVISVAAFGWMGGHPQVLADGSCGGVQRYLERWENSSLDLRRQGHSSLLKRVRMAW
ncbi:hypothetical protein B1218_38215, partial [Pseudomonas ogarae]